MKKSLLLIAAFFLVTAAFSQEVEITLENPSFEDHGSFTKVKGWDGACADAAWTDLFDIPGWSSDEPALDSGVEPSDTSRTVANDASWAFLMNGDPGVWQLTDHTIVAGDVFTLMFETGSTWQATSVAAYLYFDDNGSREWIDSLIADGLADGVHFKDTSFTVTIEEGSPAIGNYLGIEFINNSADWAGLENIRLYMEPGVVGINNMQAADINVYISNQTLFIEIPNSMLTKVSCFDLTGKCVFKDVFNSYKFNSTLDLHKGIYVIKIENETGVSTHKLLFK